MTTHLQEFKQQRDDLERLEKALSRFKVSGRIERTITSVNGRHAARAQSPVCITITMDVKAEHPPQGEPWLGHEDLESIGKIVAVALQYGTAEVLEHGLMFLKKRLVEKHALAVSEARDVLGIKEA